MFGVDLRGWLLNLRGRVLNLQGRVLNLQGRLVWGGVLQGLVVPPLYGWKNIEDRC